MKGKLLQTKTGWIIRYEDLIRLYPFSQYGMKEIHIHPDIQKYYFLDEDADGADVEFEIVTDDNGVRCAKLVRPETGIDLDKLEQKLDNTLAEETDWTLGKWLRDKRDKQSEALDFLAEQAQELDMGYEGYIGDDDIDEDKIDQILDKAMGGEAMKPLEKAQQLYTDAYTKWCYELSHDKNEAIAKSIAQYVCNEVLGYMGADRGYEFWCYVRDIIKHGGHSELYITKKP
jgi:hypothetical protein